MVVVVIMVMIIIVIEDEIMVVIMVVVVVKVGMKYQRYGSRIDTLPVDLQLRKIIVYIL